MSLRWIAVLTQAHHASVQVFWVEVTLTAEVLALDATLRVLRDGSIPGLKSEEIENTMWGYPESPDDVLLRTGCGLLCFSWDFEQSWDFKQSFHLITKDEALHGGQSLHLHGLVVSASVGL